MLNQNKLDETNKIIHSNRTQLDALLSQLSPSRFLRKELSQHDTNEVVSINKLRLKTPTVEKATPLHGVPVLLTH